MTIICSNVYDSLCRRNDFACDSRLNATIQNETINTATGRGRQSKRVFGLRLQCFDIKGSRVFVNPDNINQRGGGTLVRRWSPYFDDVTIGIVNPFLRGTPRQIDGIDSGFAGSPEKYRVVSG